MGMEMDMEQRAQQLATLYAEPNTEQPQKPTDAQVGHALADIVSDPTKAVNTKISGAIGEKMDSDAGVKNRVDKIAKNIIDNATTEAENKSEKGAKKAIFENNKAACQLIGVNEETTPKWVVKVATVIEAFWYAVWCFIAFFTVAPVVFLSIKIKVILKNTWVAVLIAVLIYLAATFLPVILKLCNVY